MTFVKRALAYLRVNIVKTILLIVVFFVASSFLIVMYGINATSEHTRKLVREQMHTVVYYGFDSSAYYVWIRDNGEEIPYELELEYSTITYEEVLPLINDERVVAMNSVVGAGGIAAETLEPIIRAENYNGTEIEPQYTCFGVYINGYDDMIEFHDGTFQIVEGRFYSEDEIKNYAPVVLITQELAELNNLQVGDTITIHNEKISYYSYQGGDGGGQPSSGIEYKDEQYIVYLDLEIIGIYTNSKVHDISIETKVWGTTTLQISENPENQLLMPYTTSRKMSNDIEYQLAQEYLVYGRDTYGTEEYLYRLEHFDYEQEYINGKIPSYFLLDSPESVDSFLEDHADMEVNYRFFYANNEEYEKLTEPLNLVKQISNIGLIIVICVAIAFVSLITSFTFKIREYEIGLQIAFGIKKIKIAGQLLVEFLVVSTIGFCISLVFSFFVLTHINNYLTQNMVSDSSAIESELSGNESYIQSGFFVEINEKEFFENFKIEYSASFIFMSYMLIIFVVATSIIVPMIMISKKTPKSIIMNRE